MAETQAVYRSPNGDDWLVELGADSQVAAVIHRSNAASGGAQTRYSVEEFLQRSEGSPEAQAVREALKQ